ncbi:NAD(P)-dependent oxidoreductase [Convivina praedatoris]|uniref:(R)-2-hydroxyglutarate dehydrogenase n=1 Tax=Convivina praedatoris TaxID=2880963 RepID=A0ABM9D3G9_9LACO|nr:NAD(P)-dependent oxidoreductase [Convivina sp. LMG 32447]CAH1852145.1 (R)-2-hydroxyglutarate dehydrogenase [Convivina sp. LMG 32447]CAH1852178.1 (R)-2-hydroxyglutarate dehydrogenase [Convivina sp. LMG 32447]CAH1852767.1 (R)-2-hydroxyglutarate dehydrogenase [Convivina sp. LMG 32447]
MSVKIIIFGVRDSEIELFQQLKPKNFKLKLISDNLTHENIVLTAGYDGVLLRANNLADAHNLNQMKAYGIRYIFTRTVGYNHIDLNQAQQNGQIVAYVPSYSPYAVADLAFSLGIMQSRLLPYTIRNTSQGDFRINGNYLTIEFQNMTVGIIGTGKIGRAEARLWQGVGAQVFAYDRHPKQELANVVSYVTQKELLKSSDIVSLHIPYIKGGNENFFGKGQLIQMKASAVLVNTSRAEITDEEAILDAVEDHQIKAFATDVIKNEAAYFGKKIGLADGTVGRMQSLYPRVIVTPHLGSFTNEALNDMITTSFLNFEHALAGDFDDNFLVKPITIDE